MYHIYKIASNTVVDFAAEELKKISAHDDAAVRRHSH